MVWHDLSPQAPPLLDRAGNGLRFYAPKSNLLYRDINAVRGNSGRLRAMRDFWDTSQGQEILMSVENGKFLRQISAALRGHA